MQVASSRAYQALIVISFGGPEGPDEVVPFLENTLRGRDVGRERMLEVARHYDSLGGVSPINAQNRELISALERELRSHSIELPIYFGNRNWHPLLADTLKQMRDDGVREALAFCTSAYSSYSGCRQYREDIVQAREQIGPGAPEIHKLRVFFNHPGFVEANSARIADAFDRLDSSPRVDFPLLFTAHSIPLAMAGGCRYEDQLKETCRLVAAALGHNQWELVYQSRSGPPHQPWLEPDVVDRIVQLSGLGIDRLVLAPIGFLSDHMEVVYDLDGEAADACQQAGIRMARAASVGTHPRFVQTIRQLVQERLEPRPSRAAIGAMGPSHDCCPSDCCLPG